MSQITQILDSIFKTNGGTTRQWRNANEILLTHTEEAKKYVAYMKNKIRDLNKNTQLLALDFLDYSVDDGKMPLWTQVGSKDFLNSLVNIYKTRNDEEVQIKILYLIQKWGIKFKKYNTIIPYFSSIFENLKDNDVEFPDDVESTYEKYLQSGNNNSYNNSNNNNSTNKLMNSENNNYLKKINVDLRTTSYERKYKRLVNKLDDWTQQIQDANVYMDQANDGYDDELRGICNELETGKKQLIDTIESGKLKDEKLMEISLNVQEDIDSTLRRWEDVKNGRKPEEFKSSFFNTKNSNNNNFENKNNFSSSNNNNQNKGGFDLLGFDDDFSGGNYNMNNNGNNNNSNIGNDLFDVFSGSNNNNMNNIINNNQGNNFFDNLGNNNNNQNQSNNMNQNLFSNNNINMNNNNFFDNNNNQNQNNNDLFSQIFNNNNANINNNVNNLQNNLNTVYTETNKFGLNFNNNNINNNINNNTNNSNFNNIMSFNGSNSQNNNFNGSNQNNKNASNKDFVFNF